jgi:hypothetical protein
MSAVRAALLALCALLPLPAAQAWDPAGHMLVDQIAWEQMTPAARNRATELVKTLDARFNGDQPYNFVTAGCWLDDMRGLAREYRWSKLHYVDIPWTPSGSPVAVPPGPHVISGLDEAIKTLRAPATAAPQRTEALGMLIHFVGDIHQPLHTAERGSDRGGNTYLVSGLPLSELPARQPPNLHSFWDEAYRLDGSGGKIVRTWAAPPVIGRPRAPGEGVIAVQAAKLLAEFPRASLPELTSQDATALAWATETYRVACAHAYPPGDPPPNTEVRPLTPEFVHDSRQIAERRLVLAGYRLGALLDDLLGR